MALEQLMFVGQMAMIQFLAQLPQQPVVVAVRTTAHLIRLAQMVVLAAVDRIRLAALLPRIPVAPEEPETLQVFLHHKAQTVEPETALLQTLAAVAVVAHLLLEILDHQQLVALAALELRQLSLDHPQRTLEAVAAVVKTAALVVVVLVVLAAAAQERATQMAWLQLPIQEAAAVVADFLRQPCLQVAQAALASSSSSTPYPYSLS